VMGWYPTGRVCSGYAAGLGSVSHVAGVARASPVIRVQPQVRPHAHGDDVIRVRGRGTVAVGAHGVTLEHGRTPCLVLGTISALLTSTAGLLNQASVSRAVAAGHDNAAAWCGADSGCAVWHVASYHG
jgi:hypothetical protein